MTRYLGRNEILNTKNNEFNSAASLAWTARASTRPDYRGRQETWK